MVLSPAGIVKIEFMENNYVSGGFDCVEPSDHACKFDCSRFFVKKLDIDSSFVYTITC